MEANEEFTATTLERLRQACGAWYRSDPEPDSREQDEWKLIHRHGDLAPVDDTPSVPMPNSGRAR